MDELMYKIMTGHPDAQRMLMSKFDLTKAKSRKIAMKLAQSGEKSKWLTAKDGSKLEVYIRPDGMVGMGYEPNPETDKSTFEDFLNRLKDEQDQANKDLSRAI